MIRNRAITVFAGAALLPLAALVLAGCGSSSGAGATPATTTATAQSATVDVATTGLGKTLVDSHGLTLYLFKNDSGTTSTCTGQCATFWPPLTVSGTPTVGSEATASMVGTTKRPDGTTQVTYNGHPLYTYSGDTKAGDTTGQGVVAFGAAWFALSPAGTQLSGSASSSSGTSGY